MARFIALYTIILTLTYSAISYKTPWCMLSFLHGMILAAGIGAGALFQFCNRRWMKAATSGLLVLAAAHLGWQAWQANYVYESDRANPYVYAQTVPDTLELVDQVKALSKVHPDGDQMLIKVMVPESDYWPLPWYLRQFKRVGWWDHLPEDPYAAVMIVGAKFCPSLDAKSNPGWTALGIHGLRPGTFLQVYVEADLWQRYLKSAALGR
jgi:predicted membrane-bound mannosyltransferase